MVVNQSGPVDGWLSLGTIGSLAGTGTVTNDSPSKLTLIVRGNLPVGDYYALLTCRKAGGTQVEYLTVVLSVKPAASFSPTSNSIYPQGLVVWVDGHAKQQNVDLNVPTSTMVNAMVSPGTSWLTASVGPSMYGGQTVQFLYTQMGVAPGIHQGTVTFSFPAFPGFSFDVPTYLIVPGTGCMPTSLLLVPRTLGNNFVATTGWPTNLEVQLVDNCGNPVVGATVYGYPNSGNPGQELVLADNGNGIYSGTWVPTQAGGGTSLTLAANTYTGVTTVQAGVILNGSVIL